MIAALPHPQPDNDLIGYVEHLLELVKSGEVVSVACATELRGRSIGTFMGGDIDVYRTLGALESLKRRIMDDRDA